MAEDSGKKEEETRKVIHTYPLVKKCDMNEDMRNEAIELIATACEKHQNSNDMAARVIKETLDRKYGPAWHAVVGEAYGFHVNYECKTLMYLYFGGNLGICIWKC